MEILCTFRVSLCGQCPPSNTIWLTLEFLHSLSPCSVYLLSCPSIFTSWEGKVRWNKSILYILTYKCKLISSSTLLKHLKLNYFCEHFSLHTSQLSDWLRHPVDKGHCETPSRLAFSTETSAVQHDEQNIFLAVLVSMEALHSSELLWLHYCGATFTHSQKQWGCPFPIPPVSLPPPHPPSYSSLAPFVLFKRLPAQAGGQILCRSWNATPQSDLFSGWLGPLCLPSQVEPGLRHTQSPGLCPVVEEAAEMQAGARQVAALPVMYVPFVAGCIKPPRLACGWEDWSQRGWNGALAARGT